MSLHSQEKGMAYVRPLFSFLLILAVSYILYHSLAGGTLLQHSNYDSYSLMAENWLHGHLDLPDGAERTWLELAIYEGKYYISFPPIPAVLLLPWVLLGGGAAAVPSHLVVAGYGLLAAAGVYCLFARRRFSPLSCVFWSALCVCGSNLYWMTTNGGVWFQAQAANFVLLVWGMYFAFEQGTAQHTLAALLLALAVGCRPFSILYLALFFLVLLWQEGGGETRQFHCPGKGFWLPFAVAALVGLGLAWLNWVRFGSILEFGHNWLPEFQQAPEGQFSLTYLWVNLGRLLRPVLFTKTMDLSFSRFDGFAFFVANPVFLWWGIRLAKRIHKRQFSHWDGLALGGFALTVVLLCLHRTLGGWQFGARYLVDCIPYVLLSELCVSEQDRTDPSWGGWLLCVLSVLFNTYGAVYMLSH